MTYPLAGRVGALPNAPPNPISTRTYFFTTLNISWKSLMLFFFSRGIDSFVKYQEESLQNNSTFQHDSWVNRWIWFMSDIPTRPSGWWYLQFLVFYIMTSFIIVKRSFIAHMPDMLVIGFNHSVGWIPSFVVGKHLLQPTSEIPYR